MRSRPRIANPNRHALAIMPAVFALLGGVTGCVGFSGDDPTLRTPGALINDEKLERQAKQQIVAANERLAASRIKVVSYDGVVLLVGQVSDAALREQAALALRDIPQIRRVHNEIQVSGATGLMARANDDWLTAKVIARLAASDQVDANSVKVVIEHGVVYLIGILPRADADAAAEVARTVFGVNKVVKVFEYLE